MAASRIEVLVVDDSAVVRQAVSAVLAADRTIHVLGAVADPLFAMQRMRAQWPDVIVLDIEMPRMDGITFLRQLMAERPTPVVVCSTLTTRGAATTMQALAAGAVAIVAKPRAGVRDYLLDASAGLVRTVKAAARANLRNLVAPANAPAPVPLPGEAQPLTDTTEKVVAIGTSTGGTQALEAILAALPAATPGIVIVQHMPEKFTAAFAGRLDMLCRIEVREARDGDRVRPGRALIAPGGRHMTLVRSGAQYVVAVKDGPLVHHHRPSVDVLFRSVAQTAGQNALGIIMTGMGADGARGLQAMHQAGARAVAQDEATCVVFGMPREAIKLGAVDAVLPLQELPREIMRLA
ncbi:chemotaxis response regulator protein-glutamate methylesterase [Ramlibacter sp. RBP-2]|uniref:Protein-glutamate methylesterase/protein-glutamine glutaminase n=1 Tax=Ramlibacter lithotrophicus TaxID=2606681 RepID=A0A7X6DI07_9BURK|nr:chemotaxis response regulator protein-glutamate methylesterase [Ramlibacter lithotrophicus]NKE67515.1 chemotaxis response regulator protein-glutamate methylesterase [Ramlibacter lithotrophicus]